MDELLKETVKIVVDAQYPEMSYDGRKQIENILIHKEVEKGEIMLQAGQIGHSLIFVGKGMLRQFYYKNKRDLTEHFACEDAVFICIESFLRQQPTRLMVEVLENTVIYGIPHDPLLALCAEDYDMEVLYRRLLENSLILSQHKADFFRFETANERYARLLREQPEIVRRAPLSHIASYLLMTPETLSRVRANVQL